MKHKGRVEGYPFARLTIVTLSVFILSLLRLWRLNAGPSGLAIGIEMILVFYFITLPSSQMLFVMFFMTYLEKFKFSLRPSLFFSCITLAPVLFAFYGFFTVESHNIMLVITWFAGTGLAMSYVGILGKIYANKTVPKKIICMAVITTTALIWILFYFVK